MTSTLVFSPLIPLFALLASGVVAFVFVGLALAQRLRGGWLRALGAGLILLALAGPSIQIEERAPLGDYLIAVVDRTASQSLPGRRAQTDAALSRLEGQVAARPGLSLEVVEVLDGADDRGSLLKHAVSQAMAALPRDRIAGVVILSDGLSHDGAFSPEVGVPVHLLQTGRAADWDRRISILNAPAFAILGEEQDILLRVDDLGAGPGEEEVALSISIDGGAPATYQVPLGRELTLPVTLTHGGANVIQLETPSISGELTDRNNTAVVSMNGVRDRLRVLLVTGVPHPGTRTWRNLLKSDSAVDLVHFTILRPPEKQDGVPVSELSLIAFPTQELFLEKIDEFDLIIFDRYKMRGILPSSYLASVRDYVARGGAALVAAGPDLATAQSLARSPLAEILPAQPTARVLEEGYVPKVTEAGERHPVTRGLEALAPEGGWGRWMRIVELDEVAGTKVMAGPDDLPLLTLDRVGEGRIALLASDHAWMWSRGYEGGGPQLDLLKRLAHWMMKEPELEEEALSAVALGAEVTITRRSMDTGPREVIVIRPDGSTEVLPLTESTPGVFETTFSTEELGLYRLSDESESAVVAVGPASPREFVETIASAAPLAPLIEETRGGVFALEETRVDLREVRAGRVAAGRTWAGYTPRGAYEVESLKVIPLAPPWLALLLVGLAVIGAWLWEGRMASGTTLRARGQ